MIYTYTLLVATSIYIYIIYMHASLHMFTKVLYYFIYEGMFYNIRRYILSSMVRNVRTK